MQWLIDIILETIGIPPCYIDRGDPTDEDFSGVDLTDDNDYHELDLSGIIPINAKAVHLQLTFTNINVGASLFLRKVGNVNSKNITVLFTYLAFIPAYISTFVAVDENRKIEYKLSAGNWNLKQITVRGWIL